MSSLCLSLRLSLPSILRKRSSEEISEDESNKNQILEKNIKMWEEAVKPENSTRNKFITAHGNINEKILAKEFCDNNDTTELAYEVPSGVIIVDLAQDNTVVFSNPSQDMEMAVFKSNPNWITTPIFGEEEQLKNPNFNDDKKIQTNVDIKKEKEIKNELEKKFENDVKTIIASCKPSSTSTSSTSLTTTSSIVKTVKDRCQCTNINKILNPKDTDDITLNDYRMAAQELGTFDIDNAYEISVELVEKIDKYLLKEEFGLNDDLYTFNREHPNFDPQGPDMVMYCTHIYFPGDEIHNKIMEWDDGKDFNIFNMIDTNTIPLPITKKKIHDMLWKKSTAHSKETNKTNKELDTKECYYVENSIKEYPSQIINDSVDSTKDFRLLDVYDNVNKTKFPNKNDNIGKPFQLKDLIDKLKPGENENPIIIYLNSCSPTIRNKDNLLLDHRTERNRRLVRRNILKSRLAIDKQNYALKEAEINEDMNINNFLTKINIIKNDLYNKGRQNFIALRNALKNNETKEVKDKKRNELPRLHKTIVMMGVDERADWYQNVMGAFFSQLKKPNQGDYESIQQDGMNVLYEQAKRDAFNRAIYVLYKNWKNYDNNHKQNGWPKIEWPDDNSKQYENTPTWMNTTAYGGRKKKTRKKRKKRRRKKTRRKRKKRRRKKTRKRRRRTRRKR